MVVNNWITGLDPVIAWVNQLGHKTSYPQITGNDNDDFFSLTLNNYLRGSLNVSQTLLDQNLNSNTAGNLSYPRGLGLEGSRNLECYVFEKNTYIHQGVPGTGNSHLVQVSLLLVPHESKSREI